MQIITDRDAKNGMSLSLIMVNIMVYMAKLKKILQSSILLLCHEVLFVYVAKCESQ